MTAKRGLTIASVITTLTLLVGCSTGVQIPAEVDEPATMEEPTAQITPGGLLPSTEVDQLLLPYAFQELPTFTLPYDAPPLTLEGVLFGLREVGGELEFTAVATDGQILWTARRPATCSGFTLTYAGDTPIAVLTDTATTPDALAQITASAYNLHTGEPLWGPVPVPGPWHGPGAVFAEAAPAAAMGSVGERVALDPGTGAPLVIEGALIGEFDGVALSFSPTTGMITASGSSSWSIPISAVTGTQTAANLLALPGPDAPHGYALLTAGKELGALVRLSDGHVLSTQATAAAWDPAAEVLLVGEPSTLAGFTAEGPAWSRGVREDLQLVATGGVLTYLRSDSAVQVVNAITGDDAVGYDPAATRYAVPLLITADGAAVFSLPDLTLAGTHPSPVG